MLDESQNRLFVHFSRLGFLLRICIQRNSHAIDRVRSPSIHTLRHHPTMDLDYKIPKSSPVGLPRRHLILLSPVYHGSGAT